MYFFCLASSFTRLNTTQELANQLQCAVYYWLQCLLNVAFLVDLFVLTSNVTGTLGLRGEGCGVGEHRFFVHT